MKIFFWLFFVACTGMLGYSLGVAVGAKTIGSIAAQNASTEALHDMRATLDVLAQNNLSAANALHEQNFRTALVKLGSNSRAVIFWKCSAGDRDTLAAARKHYDDIADSGHDVWRVMALQGLAFCSPPARN